MKKINTKIMVAALLIATAIVNPLLLSASTPLLIPPKEWTILPPKEPIVIGFLSKEKNYPPSMNLAVERCSLTIDAYVEVVKERTKNNPSKIFRDLGTLNTKAGVGRLIQIESKTPHGLFRVVQCFVKSSDEIHIITSALHEKHFIKHFPSIKRAMESFEIVPILYEDDSEISKKIAEVATKNTNQSKKIKILEEYLSKKYPEKGIYWKLLVLAKFQNSSLQ